MTKSTAMTEKTLAHNPIDLLEDVAMSQEWAYQRHNIDEMWVEISGRWCDYRIQFYWEEDVGILQFSCLLDMRIQSKDQAAIYELLALVNERIILGHFEIAPENLMPVYRYGYFLQGNRGFTIEQLEKIIDIGIGECERFYPAFQYVIWSGKPAKEATSLVMLDVVGEA